MINDIDLRDVDLLDLISHSCVIISKSMLEPTQHLIITQHFSAMVPRSNIQVKIYRLSADGEYMSRLLKHQFWEIIFASFIGEKQSYCYKQRRMGWEGFDNLFWNVKAQSLFSFCNQTEIQTSHRNKTDQRRYCHRLAFQSPCSHSCSPVAHTYQFANKRAVRDSSNALKILSIGTPKS